MARPRSSFSAIFVVLAVTFCVCLIVSNIIEIKTISVGPLTITAGMLVFPVSYIINDCIVEVYGFDKSRLVIWTGFVMSVFVVLLTQFAIFLPGSADWQGQEAMEVMLGSVPRITCASWAAFICGSMVNARVMSRMKVRSNGRRFALRAIMSTVWGEGVDSCIFFPLAFLGVFPITTIISLIITQTCLKTLYEVIALPATMRVVSRLKSVENLDTFDYHIRYRWFGRTEAETVQP